MRGTVELLGSELLRAIEDGTPVERIGVVCESPDRWRAPLGATLPTLGVPYALEHGVRLGETPLGRALLALLRFAWLETGRADLFTFLRSPLLRSGRRSVDFVEAASAAGRSSRRAASKRRASACAGHQCRRSSSCRCCHGPLAGASGLLRTMIRKAWGLEAPPTTGDVATRAPTTRRRARSPTSDARPPLRARQSPEELLAALERARVRPAGVGEKGRVAVLDYGRARTRVFDVVFLLGLEEGACRAATARRRFSTRSCAASSGDGSTGPTRSPGTGTSSTRPARERCSASCSCGRRRGRWRPSRAEPVLARRARALRPGRREPSHSAPRSLQPHVADRRRAERTRAAAGARPYLGRRRGRSLGPRRRERLVEALRARAGGLRPTDAAPRAPPCSTPSRAGPPSPRPSSSASPTARPPGSSSASWRRGRSMPSRTRSSGVRSCTRRSTASTRCCPRSSTRSA